MSCFCNEIYIMLFRQEFKAKDDGWNNISSFEFSVDCIKFWIWCLFIITVPSLKFVLTKAYGRLRILKTIAMIKFTQAEPPPYTIGHSWSIWIWLSFKRSENTWSEVVYQKNFFMFLWAFTWKILKANWLKSWKIQSWISDIIEINPRGDKSFLWFSWTNKLKIESLSPLSRIKEIKSFTLRFSFCKRTFFV